MTDNFEYKSDKSDNNELNDICDECKKEDETVTQNLILTGYKLCNSCRTSKTLFPFQIFVLIGNELIFVITNEIVKKEIIRNDKKTIPNAFKLDFKFKICLVAIINEAKIQN